MQNIFNKGSAIFVKLGAVFIKNAYCQLPFSHWGLLIGNNTTLVFRLPRRQKLPSTYQ